MAKAFTPDPDNKEFQDALNLVSFSNQSFFLTGKAGTGKSTFIKYVCEHTRKKHVVLAPTGIAAINVGGATLHSFFHLPLHLILPDDPNYSLRHGKIFESLRYNRDMRKLINEVQLIIIDEVSMVRCDIIDFIDKVLRVFCRKMREPFGGKQVVFVGDVFQLEPVVHSDELEILHRFYPNAFFFSARVFQQMPLLSIELRKVYRQRDKAFISVLDRIRTNTITPTDLQLLNLRQTAVPQEGRLCITLATRRDKVDFINDQHLSSIDDDIVCLKGEIKGEFPKTSLPTLQELELKRGAQVMLLYNDPDRRWVNGTLAKVVDFGEEFEGKENRGTATRHVHAISLAVGLGHHHPQEPGTDPQQRHHRPLGRCFCCRADLCGPEPLQVVGRHTALGTHQILRRLRTWRDPTVCPWLQRPETAHPDAFLFEG